MTSQAHCTRPQQPLAGFEFEHLMTPSLHKEIAYGVMYDHTLFFDCCLQITREDIRSQLKWAINPVIANGIFLRDLCGYVRDNMLTLSPLWVPVARSRTVN